jgi:RHS repeat-associated protein
MLSSDAAKWPVLAFMGAVCLLGATPGNREVLLGVGKGEAIPKGIVLEARSVMLSRLRSAGDVATVTMLPNAKLCVSAERETLVPLARLLTTRGAVSLRIVPSGPTYNVAESPISRVRIGSDEIGQYAISLTMSDPKSFRKFTGDHLNGLLGVIWQSSNASNTWGAMVYDRDQTGTAVNEHFSVGTSAGFSPLTIDNIHPFKTSCSAKNSTCSVSSLPASPSFGGPAGPDPYGTATTLLLDATRQDGYYDGSITIQGARAYDPNMNQWTTPDAYSGDVRDPMSQHPYMWNSNNPVSYGDPSGFLSDSQQALLGQYSDTFGLGQIEALGIACTDFILDAYKGVLGLDLRKEVQGDLLRSLGDTGELNGYTLHGWSNGNFAGNADNLRNFFEQTGQLKSYTTGMRLEVGDILFMSESKTTGHVAMVSDVNKSGNPTAVIESTGTTGGVVRKTWSDFSSSARGEGMTIEGVGRDNNDSAPIVIYEDHATFYDAETAPL